MDLFIEEIKKSEWSMDYIYLDRKENMYDFKLEHVREVHSPPENTDSPNSDNDQESQSN